MRIILTFVLGVVLSFYSTQVGSKLWSRLKPNRTHLHHSSLGAVLFLAGILVYFLGDRFLISIFLIGSGFGVLVHHLMAESFIFSEKLEKNFVKKHDNLIERLLEIFPGALTWLALTSPIWLSFTLPFAVAYLIILADIYWLLSSVRIALFLYLGYKKMEHAKRVDWLEKLQQDFPKEWENYYHLLVIPTYTESLDVLIPAFDAIANSNYPKKKIFLAVGFEEREQQKSPDKIATTTQYLQKINQKIGGVFTTIHPFGLEGEVPGPGTNRNWIIKNAVKEFNKLGIGENQVLVTTLDADFVIHHKFLAGALHKYLSTPKEVRDKRSFTGAFLYNNNYWQAPTPMRVIASGTAFWQLSEMVGSDKYINFSSLSINLKPLMEIGLWIPNKVNDDSGFYWKAYYHFNGDYKVIPHFLPISADTVSDVNLLKTFQNQYLQLKRWAYGVEHIPFIVKQYFHNQDMDFWNKTNKLLFILWSYLRWGTLALFVTFAGLIIPFINPHYSSSVVAYNLPVISSWILTGAFLGLLSTIYVNEKVVPKRPANWSILQRVWSYAQWVLIPIVLVTITSIPAIDAQTRLMLGKYMEFRVTTKVRQN